MFESNPVRKRAAELFSEFIIGTAVAFMSLLLSTGLVVAAAFQAGPRAAGYAVIACMGVGILLTAGSVFRADESEADFSEIGWIMQAVAGLLILLYFNAIVFLSVAIGVAVGPTFGAVAVTIYLIYDWESPRYGWPLGLTALTGVLLVAWFRFGELLDDTSWREFGPGDFLEGLFGKRTDPR